MKRENTTETETNSTEYHERFISKILACGLPIDMATAEFEGHIENMDFADGEMSNPEDDALECLDAWTQ
jgi:hypothetical protein